METIENAVDPERVAGEDPRKFFLSEAQHEKLARYLNAEINIPILWSEEKELSILRKIVIAVDRNTMKYIPSEILDGVNDANFQLEDVLARSLKDNLVPMLASAIPLPFLPGKIKRKILEAAVDVIVDAAAQATTIDEKVEAYLSKLRD
ncbi:MAG: hypothetical protein AAGA05_01455 [Pseudomonadota bacterium]